MEVRRIRETTGHMYRYLSGLHILRCCLNTRSLSYYFDKVNRPPRNQEELVQSIHASLQANIQPVPSYPNYWANTSSPAGVRTFSPKVLRFVQGNVSNFLCYPCDREPEFIKMESFR